MLRGWKRIGWDYFVYRVTLGLMVSMVWYRDGVLFVGGGGTECNVILFICARASIRIIMHIIVCSFIGYVSTNTRYVVLVEDSLAPENIQVQKSRDHELCLLMVCFIFC